MIGWRRPCGPWTVGLPKRFTRDRLNSVCDQSVYRGALPSTTLDPDLHYPPTMKTARAAAALSLVLLAGCPTDSPSAPKEDEKAPGAPTIGQATPGEASA